MPDAPTEIAFDFDGVVHAHVGEFEMEPKNPPVPGAKEMILELHSLGYRVVIYSARTTHFGGRGSRAIERWLKDNGFPALPVIHGKPHAAKLLVDDRGFRFEGPKSWDALRAFLRFQPVPSRWEKDLQVEPASPDAPLP